LPRRVPPPGPIPPPADQEERRDEGELEEHVEEDHVERQERPDRAALEEEQPPVERAGPVGHRVHDTRTAGIIITLHRASSHRFRPSTPMKNWTCGPGLSVGVSDRLSSVHRVRWVEPPGSPRNPGSPGTNSGWNIWWFTSRPRRMLSLRTSSAWY